MWLDLPVRLRDRLAELKESFEAADPSPLLERHYTGLSREMVDGIGSLYLVMIQNYIYAKGQWQGFEQGRYDTLHLALATSLEECLDPEVRLLPEFYRRMLEVLHHLEAYCQLLLRDLRSLRQGRRIHEADRRLRQMTLQARDAIEKIQRFMRKARGLSLLIDASQREDDLARLEAMQEDTAAWRDMLSETSMFSPEEAALLKELLSLEE